jgi:hypothetical protein
MFFAQILPIVPSFFCNDNSTPDWTRKEALSYGFDP